MRIIPSAAQDAGESFEGVTLGIRALCAAAAVVIGVGQAEAATVDRVKLTITAEYVCNEYDCDEPAPVAATFFGIPTGAPITGDLYIADRDQYRLQVIHFTTNGVVHRFGNFIDWLSNGRYQRDPEIYSSNFFLDWNGTAGSFWYQNDSAPYYLDAYGTIELAPVPLPASAALLPLGFGALALMRRRRKA